MSRVLVICSEAPVSREIGEALSAADFPMEYSAGDADTLQRLRVRSFGVVITNPDSSVEEDLALLEEMRTIRPEIIAKFLHADALFVAPVLLFHLQVLEGVGVVQILQVGQLAIHGLKHHSPFLQLQG